jgi:predicted ferric reductase
LSTVSDIIAAIQNVLWTTWSGPLSWTTVVLSLLGLVAACFIILIAMAVSMHYRLKRSFSLRPTRDTAETSSAQHGSAIENRLARVIGATVPLDSHAASAPTRNNSTA